MKSSRIDRRPWLVALLWLWTWLSGCDDQPQLTTKATPGAQQCEPACVAPSQCVAGRCQSCVPGAVDCTCRADSSCDGGLGCSAGVCTRTGEVSGCYSPCKQGFTDEGGRYRACSADGLMEGCLDDRTCVDGSCLKAAEFTLSPAQCQSDIDCPDFQRCTPDGSCQAECEGNSDCEADHGCDRRVCRARCSAEESTCPDGTHCAISDSQNGFCEPLAQPTGSPVLGIEGTFSVSSQTLAFTNVETRASLTVTNNSPRTLEFVLRKVEQRTFTRNGLNVSKKDPLPFLEIGPEGQLEKRSEATLTIEAGQSASFGLELSADDAESVPEEWQGTLDVGSEDLGNRRVDVRYRRTAHGRWAGKVYYFTQFGDRNLDDWLQNRADPNATSAVGNAFIQKWANLRLGKISFSDLEAVIVSTITESWRWPDSAGVHPQQTSALLSE